MSAAVRLDHSRVCLRCRGAAPKRGCLHCPTCIPLSFAGRFLRRGPANDNQGPTRPASCPTSYHPGSQGKIAAMEARVERGESLYHPGDAGQD